MGTTVWQNLFQHFFSTHPGYQLISAFLRHPLSESRRMNHQTRSYENRLVRPVRCKVDKQTVAISYHTTTTICLLQDINIPVTDLYRAKTADMVFGSRVVLIGTSWQQSQSPWTVGVPCRRCGVVPVAASEPPSPRWIPRRSCSRLPDGAENNKYVLSLDTPEITSWLVQPFLGCLPVSPNTVSPNPISPNAV